MAPVSQEKEPPANPGRFNNVAGEAFIIGVGVIADPVAAPFLAPGGVKLVPQDRAIRIGRRQRRAQMVLVGIGGACPVDQPYARPGQRHIIGPLPICLLTVEKFTGP